MTEIVVPMQPISVRAVESYDSGKRYRWTVTKFRKADGGIHLHTHCEEVPDVGPLLFIPEGPDVDAVAIHDLTQMAKEKPRRVREKPDLTAMYQRFNEVRARELDTKTVHPVAKVSHDE